jgi:hypothetical protein
MEQISPTFTSGSFRFGEIPILVTPPRPHPDSDIRQGRDAGQLYFQSTVWEPSNPSEDDTIKMQMCDLIVRVRLHIDAIGLAIAQCRT